MSNRTLPGTKRTYYIREATADAWMQFTTEGASWELPAAMETYAALPPGARDEIRRRCWGMPWAKAVALARQIIEEAVLDQFRAKYMRGLPPKKQVQLIGAIRKKAKK